MSGYLARPRPADPILPVTLLVVAKAPVAGLAKTRLTPPLTPAQAARLAGAALLDTLDAVLRCRVAHRVVAMTGDLALAEYRHEITAQLGHFEVVPQRGAGFGIRLANAHADAARAGWPVLQIGMDTPQLDSRTLAHAAQALSPDGDVLLGPAEDGGWWGLGLPTPQVARALAEVPMSTEQTGALTRVALRRWGYQVRELPQFTDVDHYADAVRVAAACGGRFAAEMNAFADSGLVRP